MKLFEINDEIEQAFRQGHEMGYRQGVEACKAQGFGIYRPNICNAFKYLWRHNKKNALEDIKKARWYIDRYITMQEKDESGGDNL